MDNYIEYPELFPLRAEEIRELVEDNPNYRPAAISELMRRNKKRSREGKPFNIQATNVLADLLMAEEVLSVWHKNLRRG